MEFFKIKPNGTNTAIDARFIGAIVDPHTIQPRKTPAWLGTSYQGTPEGQRLVAALMTGDADTATDIISEYGDEMTDHFNQAHADWLCDVMPDQHDTSWTVEAGPNKRFDRCAVAFRAGIAFVMHAHRVYLFQVAQPDMMAA